MFSKILVANRGEIAVRIIRACKEMGISTVGVYSVADSESLHVALADESYCIGGADSRESYLDINRVLSAAVASGAQAIHPGYGFLSENAEFAKACRDNSIVFIGPEIDVIKMLENKENVKKLMKEQGIDVIPGSDEISNADESEIKADEMGYPVVLKASCGGGGRGIRIIKNKDDIKDGYMAAVSEAEAAFGNGRIYMEKFISPAKHIEFQIIADEFGNVVCFDERDCSVQMNNRKLIEESPSAEFDKNKRSVLKEGIKKAVKELEFSGLGTLEFLMDNQGKLYFMEMNIRLQVEHTVTESLYGIDLVKWQIRIAAGMPLGFSENYVIAKGSSIECRINAISSGKVNFLHIPGGPFVRFDTALLTGDVISNYYDSLVGKLVVYASTREECLRKMKAALCELVIDGVKNNIDSLIRLIQGEAFMSGKYDLEYCKRIEALTDFKEV